MRAAREQSPSRGEARVPLGQDMRGLTVKIGDADMHKIDTVAGEARSDLDVLLLHVEDEREEALNLRG